MVLAGLTIFLRNVSTEDRLNFEDFKEAIARDAGADSIRFVVSNQGKVSRVERLHPFEALILRLIIDETRSGEAGFATPAKSAGVCSPHHHKLVRILIWQRS